jgi:hypothetical protein
VRILFLVQSMSRVRHFESVIRELARRGHTVRIAAGPNKLGPPTLPETLLGWPSVSAVQCPTARSDGWCDLVTQLRGARDYIRYLDPRYSGARFMAKRARQSAPIRFVQLCRQSRWIKDHPSEVAKILDLIEDAVPSDRVYERFLRSERPDIVLVTPLIDFGSYQTDYVKSAHRLGLPIAFLPFSWDNLTNKGAIRIHADLTIVWNETQMREAVELHGARAERIVVTGAPRFDEFFGMKPSMPRERFCRMIGLDPQRPYILYLCSSEFVAPQEVEFVREWISAIRRSPDPALRECGVLVRRHPANWKPWERVRWPELRNVALWAPEVSKQGDQGLYDSIYHAATVAGLNTTAMIEAGILGKSVHAIQTAQHNGGRRRTLHFDYLLHANGGLVSVAHDLDKHCRQLSEALASQDARREQTLRFVEGFVRPRGLRKPATPFMVEEIERLGTMRKSPKGAPFPLHYLVRPVLARWLRLRGESIASPVAGEPLEPAIR